jgi:hypothetical protein
MVMGSGSGFGSGSGLEVVSGPEVVMVEIGFIRNLLTKGSREPGSPTAKAPGIFWVAPISLPAVLKKPQR